MIIILCMHTLSVLLLSLKLTNPKIVANSKHCIYQDLCVVWVNTHAKPWQVCRIYTLYLYPPWHTMLAYWYIEHWARLLLLDWQSNIVSSVPLQWTDWITADLLWSTYHFDVAIEPACMVSKITYGWRVKYLIFLHTHCISYCIIATAIYSCRTK